MAETTAIGKNIKRLRKEMGLSQRELAEASGVSRTTISALEGGATELNITSKTLLKLAGALKTTVDCLFFVPSV